MGLITNLIRENADRKHQEKEEQINHWKTILSMPDESDPNYKGPLVSKQMKQWAMQNLTGMLGEGLGLPKGKHDIIHGLLSKVAGLNPMPGQPKPPAGQPPQQQVMSDQEGQQARQGFEQQQLAKQKQIADQKAQEAAQAEQAKLQATNKAKTEADEQAYQTRLKRERELGLTGPAGQEYGLTGKLPTAFGKPEPTPKPTKDTPTSMALGSYAEKHGKTPDQLTAQEKVKAVKEYHQEMSNKATAKAKSTALVAHAESAAGKQYVPGGKSISNPHGDNFIEMAAIEWLTNDKIPFTGMGSGKKGEPNKREMAVGRAYEILKDLGFEPTELPSIRSKLKANMTALSKVTTMGALTKQFEGTVDRNMKLAKHLSDIYSRTNSPFINRIKNGIDTQSGDPVVNNFNSQMQTLAYEYGRVMSGATNSSGTTIHGTEDAKKYINSFLAKGQIDALFKQMGQDMDNRTSAIETEKQSLANTLRLESKDQSNKRDEEAVKPTHTGGGGGVATQSTQSLPKPDRPGKRLDVETAKKFLALASGDKDKAREMAKQAQWSF